MALGLLFKVLSDLNLSVVRRCVCNYSAISISKNKSMFFLSLNQCYVVIIAFISEMCLLMIGTVSQVSDVAHEPLFILFFQVFMMNRKLIEVWLFLSVLGIVLLPPESSTIGASNSNDKKDDSDPKPENTGETDPSRGDPNTLNITDDSGKFPEGPVINIPQNEMEYSEQTKHVKCNPGQKAVFLLHPLKNETYVGCYKDKLIHGKYCPEFNRKGLQPKHAAPCDISICNAPYNASDGYKFRQCFKIYGGISSPKCTFLDELETTSFNVCLIFLCSVLSLPYLYICCIGFCIRKCWYNKDIAYKDYLKEARRALVNSRVQIARGPNNDREEADF